MPEITVRGRAEAQVAPTDAHLTITIHARSTGGQGEAVERCGRGAVAVDQVLDAVRADLVTKVVTSSIRTGPEYEHSPKLGRRLVAWTATRTSEVTCRPVGDLLTALVDAVARMDDVRLSGPRWSVAADADAWQEIRRAAAADARRRAEAYAAGLDVGVGRVVRITEPGLLPPPGVGEAPRMAFATRAVAREGGAEEEDPVPVKIVPEPVDVSVDVDVAFDLA